VPPLTPSSLLDAPRVATPVRRAQLVTALAVLSRRRRSLEEERLLRSMESRLGIVSRPVPRVASVLGATVSAAAVAWKWMLRGLNMKLDVFSSFKFCYYTSVRTARIVHN